MSVETHCADMLGRFSNSSKVLDEVLDSPDESLLNSILKSRDITLPTKVHLVKAMVFPVVMYGCEIWTIKKAEHRRMMLLNCGVGEDS